MTEEISQYVKDVYMFLGRLEHEPKEMSRAILYILSNPESPININEFEERFKLRRSAVFYLVDVLEKNGLLKRTKPVKEGEITKSPLCKLRQDLDENFKFLLKSELEKIFLDI